jgi:hypothetical protein
MLKKLQKYLTITVITGIAAMTLAGCSPAEDRETLMKNLTKLLPQDPDNETRVSPLPDGKGIQVTVKKNSLNLREQKDSAENFASASSEFLTGFFCQGSRISGQFSRYVNKQSYLSLVYLDSSGQEISRHLINNGFCKENSGNSFNTTKAMVKQKKQGFYDEDFLNRVYRPLLEKNLPRRLAPNLVLERAAIGPGSEIHFYVQYTPPPGEDKRNSAEVLDGYLEQMYQEACKGKSSRHLISMLDKMKWHGIINNREITNLVAGKECK